MHINFTTVKKNYESIQNLDQRQVDKSTKAQF